MTFMFIKIIQSERTVWDKLFNQNHKPNHKILRYYLRYLDIIFIIDGI